MSGTERDRREATKRVEADARRVRGSGRRSSFSGLSPVWPLLFLSRFPFAIRRKAELPGEALQPIAEGGGLGETPRAGILPELDRDRMVAGGEREPLGLDRWIHAGEAPGEQFS